MRIELIFLTGCFAFGLAMICWRLMVSPAIRDWKVCALAKTARSTSAPIEVIINFIPIPAKFGLRPDAWNFDIQANHQHWYFSICSFWTPTVVTKLKHGERGLMYMATSENFVACCIEVKGDKLLGTLSDELPTEPDLNPKEGQPEDDSWKKMRIV